MIGRITKGKGFRGLLNYLLSKEEVLLLESNMFGESARELAREFSISRSLRPEIKQPVFHASLSLAPGEHLDDDQWRAAAATYLNQMGFENSQYLVIKHFDTDHEHIHIVASRIDLDGNLVRDSWEYLRSQKLIRNLEKEYELTSAEPKRENSRRGQTLGEYRQLERTGEESIRLKLQNLIDEKIEPKQTIPELINQLRNQGIDARITYTRTGKIKGISYKLNGIAFSGTHLGKAYTFPGLQKYRGIEYAPNQDLDIQAASAREPTSVTQNQEVSRTEITGESSQLPELPVTKEHTDLQKARFGIEVFNQLLKMKGKIDESYRVKYQNHKWSVEKDGSNLSVTRNHDQSILLKAKDDLVNTWTANAKEQEMVAQAAAVLVEMKQNARKIVNNFLNLVGETSREGRVEFRGKELEIIRDGKHLRVTRHKDKSTLLETEGERVVQFTPNDREWGKIEKMEEFVVEQLQLQKRRQRESQMEL